MIKILRFLIRPLIYLCLFSGPVLYASYVYSESYKYQLLKDRYSWMTEDRYQHIKNNSHKLKISNPEFFIAALIQSESEGYRFAESPVGARGLMQIMGFWVPKHKRNDLFNAKYNIEVGTKILAGYHRQAKGNLRRTLKNYNSGPASRYWNTEYINRVLGQYHTLDKRMKKHILYLIWRHQKSEIPKET